MTESEPQVDGLHRLDTELGQGGRMGRGQGIHTKKAGQCRHHRHVIDRCVRLAVGVVAEAAVRAHVHTVRTLHQIQVDVFICTLQESGVGVNDRSAAGQRLPACTRDHVLLADTHLKEPRVAVQATEPTGPGQVCVQHSEALVRGEHLGDPAVRAYHLAPNAFPVPGWAPGLGLIASGTRS